MTTDFIIQPLNPLPDVQRLLGDISRSQVYRLLGRGDLRAKKLCDRLMITGESLHALLDRLPDAEIRVYRRQPAPGRPTRPAA